MDGKCLGSPPKLYLLDCGCRRRLGTKLCYGVQTYTWTKFDS